jgi:hypothetical protein
LFCQRCGARAGAGLPSYSQSSPTVAQAVPAVAMVPGWGGDTATVLPTGSMPDSRAANAAVGSAELNSSYLGRRLMYDVNPEPSFDPLGSPRYLTQMALRYFLYVWVFAFAAIIMLPLLLGGPLYPIALFIVGIVLICCYWFLKVPIKLSEWKFSVDGKGEAAPMVLDHIAWVLRQRGTPLNSVTLVRLHPPADTAKDYLELRSTIFYGYIACFPYGTDLYLGWTFWVRVSPFWYLCMTVARLWQSLVNKGNDLYTSLRFDTARALRETMHSATREGTDVAVGRLQAQGRGIIGTEIQIKESAG